MEYQDEKIAELKKEKRRQKYTDIRQGSVYIGGQFVKFHPRNINHNVEIYIPEEFIDMPEDMLLMKYPSINRPQVVWTSLDSSVNFSFSLQESKTLPEQTEIIISQLKEVVRRVNPAAVFYKEETSTLFCGQPVCMFDFKSFGVDEQMYNMMCIAPLECGTLFGTFNCLDRDYADWKDVAWNAFQTFREWKSEDK